MSDGQKKATIEELEQSLEQAIATARNKYDAIIHQIEEAMRSGHPPPPHLHEEQAYRAGWLHALEAVLQRLRGERSSDPAPGE